MLKQFFLDFPSQIQPLWKLWKWNRMFWKKLDLSIRLPSTNSISLYNSYKIPNFHQQILANFNPFPHARHDLLYRSIHIIGKTVNKLGVMSNLRKNQCLVYTCHVFHIFQCVVSQRSSLSLHFHIISKTGINPVSNSPKYLLSTPVWHPVQKRHIF